jgi:hypothetical protein
MKSLVAALLGCLLWIPVVSVAVEISEEGWPVPDLRGASSYSISVTRVDGVEKVVELFETADGGQVARLTGNGKIYAYAVDHDLEPPIDYLILDPNGSGRFTRRLGPEETYLIPAWVSE